MLKVQEEICYLMLKREHGSLCYFHIVFGHKEQEAGEKLGADLHS